MLRSVMLLVSGVTRVMALVVETFEGSGKNEASNPFSFPPQGTGEGILARQVEAAIVESARDGLQGWSCDKNGELRNRRKARVERNAQFRLTHWWRG